MNYHKLKMTAGFIGIVLAIILIILSLIEWAMGLYCFIRHFENYDQMKPFMSVSAVFVLVITHLAFVISLFLPSIFYYLDNKQETKEEIPL